MVPWGTELAEELRARDGGQRRTHGGRGLRGRDQPPAPAEMGHQERVHTVRDPPRGRLTPGHARMPREGSREVQDSHGDHLPKGPVGGRLRSLQRAPPGVLRGGPGGPIRHPSRRGGLLRRAGKVPSRVRPRTSVLRAAPPTQIPWSRT